MRWLCRSFGSHWLAWKVCASGALSDVNILIGRCRLCGFKRLDVKQQKSGSPRTPGNFLTKFGS